MDLYLRSKVMNYEDDKLIYLGRGLKCTGSNFYDTGFAPFSADNINKDFKITIRLSSFTKAEAQAVVLGCKYEGTIGGQQWPGIYIRRKQSTDSLEFGGYNYPYYTIASMLNTNFYIWRQSSTYYGQLEGNNVQTLPVRVASFDQNIVIGAGVQTNGTKFRYSICDIDYVRIEWL